MVISFHAAFYSPKQTPPALQRSWSMSRRRTRRRRTMRRRKRWKQTAASRTTTVLLWPQVLICVPYTPLVKWQPSHQPTSAGCCILSHRLHVNQMEKGIVWIVYPQIGSIQIDVLFDTNENKLTIWTIYYIGSSEWVIFRHSNIPNGRTLLAA